MTTTTKTTSRDQGIELGDLPLALCTYLLMGVIYAVVLPWRYSFLITASCASYFGVAALVWILLTATITGADVNSKSFESAKSAHDTRRVRLQTRSIAGLWIAFCNVVLLVSGLGGEIMALTTHEPLDPPRTISLSLLCATGYLIFEHVFSVRLCEPPHRSGYLVTEDLLTVTLILTVLVSITTTTIDNHEDFVEEEHRLTQSGQALVLWWCYRLGRCLLALVSEEKPTIDNNQKPPTVVVTSASYASPLIDGSDKATTDHMWLIHGAWYDLADFVDRHPGGREAILVGRGRDCTALFESYHPFTQQHYRVLAKYQGAVANTAKEDSNKNSSSSNSGMASPPWERDFFYQVLCDRVYQRLKERGVDPVADRGATLARFLYYSVMVLMTVTSMYFHFKGSLLGTFGVGVFGWLMGSLGHDAGHFAASRQAWLNDVGLWGMTFLTNPVLWQHQHTYAHHSFTNDFDHDPDLHHFDYLLRIHQRVRHCAFYQNQSSFWFVLYAYMFVVFGGCVAVPLSLWERGSLYNIVAWTDRPRTGRTLALTAHMVTMLVVMLVVPFTTMPWYKALLAGPTYFITSGWLFAFFSQVNHINEACMTGKPADGVTNDDDESVTEGKTKDARVAKSWAASQVETSNDFATDSVFWGIWSNLLNFQIEHHLFPGLNHCHLHHIAPVVEETCREFGVRYKCYRNFREVFATTLQWLDKLATGEE